MSDCFAYLLTERYIACGCGKEKHYFPMRTYEIFSQFLETGSGECAAKMCESGTSERENFPEFSQPTSGAFIKYLHCNVRNTRN